MNFASWVILAIVLLVVGLAIRSTFFRKNKKGGCCDQGDETSSVDCSSLGCSACSCASCPHVSLPSEGAKH